MKVKIKGLNSDEVLKSREKYGSNEFEKIKVKGIIRRFFENLNDPIIKVLIFALILEIVFTFKNCNFIEISGIVIAILISTVVSTVSEFGSEKAFSKIEKENSNSEVRVVRNGQLTSVNSQDLVVGDIILVSCGDKLYVDGKIIDGSLSVDQSALNGENIEVEKIKGNRNDFDLSNKNKVFSGSIITNGKAYILVERVGRETFYGQIAKEVQSETRESPLKIRLSKLAKQISHIGYIIAFLVGFTYIFNSIFVSQSFEWWRILRLLKDSQFMFKTAINALTLMITVVVVAVPEGLPMMITVVLSANMKKMVKDNVLVKKLVGIETAGSLNVLFTDKTGTLTEGKLSIESFVTEDSIYRKISNLKNAKEIYNYLLLNSQYNTESVITNNTVVGGNSTERAIAEYFLKEKKKTMEVTKRIPFNSEIKNSSVTFKNGLTIIKGAPEVIISKCKFALTSDGKVVSSDLKYAKEQYERAVMRGDRVIGVSIKDDRNIDIFVALIILKDKLRKGVKEAVTSVLEAGIQTVMVTGDGKETATSIAQECGIYRENAGQIVLTSKELGEMSDDDVKKIFSKIRVIARALPSDKTRLVKICEELNLVCGMTGDGINDAPSLKLSDVGFAMGSGSDIAKSSADIIILDNSFTAITKSILYGRTIFKSIRKFITFQLIMNFSACGVTLIGQFMGIKSPITIIQMLWVNIIMDTLGGLAFAGEAPLKQYMKEKPKSREEPILSKEMYSHIILNGIFTLSLLLLFLNSSYFRNYYGFSADNGAKLLSAFYALFIFSGLCNCLTARSERLLIFSNITKNKIFIFIMFAISAIQICIIYYGGTLFRSAYLSLRELATVLLLSSSVLVFDFFRRIFEKIK